MPGIGLFNVLYWIGLSLVVLSALCIAVIGARNSAWFGPRRSMLSELGRFDIKLVKFSGVLFLTGVMMFLIALLVQ